MVPNDSQIIIIITILPITGRSPSFTVDMRLVTLSLVRPIAAPLFAILPELLDGFFQRTYRTLISCDWVSLSDIKLRTLLVIGYFIRVYSIKRVMALRIELLCSGFSFFCLCCTDVRMKEESDGSRLVPWGMPGDLSSPLESSGLVAASLT